jgi:hypothetical protein
MLRGSGCSDSSWLAGKLSEVEFWKRRKLATAPSSGAPCR